MPKHTNFPLFVSFLLLCTGHNAFAETATKPTTIKNPCAIEAKKPPHKRSPRDPIDWACMRQQAAKGDQFQQYYIGIHLAYGSSIEGIKLLTNVGKHGKNKYSAMQILARIY